MTTLNTPIADEGVRPLLLDVSGITLTVTSAQYYKLNTNNQDLRLELTATGQLSIRFG
jgi:hypothetical protein